MSTSPAPIRTRGSIRLDLPAGWFFKESHTIIAPKGNANVIASSEPLDPSIDGKLYADIQGDILSSEFTGYTPRGDLEPILIEGVEGGGWRREFTWHPKDGEPVTQIQVYAVRPGRGFTATATTLTSDLENFYTVLSDVLSAIVIDAVASDAIAAVQRWEPEAAAAT